MAVSPDTTAYVIYTSGSTGRPKGVRVSHGSLLNFLDSMAERPGLGADDVMLALTSLSFDIAALELYLPLLAGARIELVEREVAADGRRLAERIAASGATVIQATPATWRMLIDAGWTGDPRLKALCGGEALPETLAAELLSRAGEVWNLYGPTETTVWSAISRLVPGEPVRLGSPIARTGLYLLGPALQPVLLGVAGELLIGGAGLARGYHGRPDLTAERFLPDPWAEAPGARMYRTGDLGRRDGQGRIEFLGRIDHQVKVRGFRIELGEIEAALQVQPEVAQVVVAAQGQGTGKRLVAYLVARPEQSLTERELRERLRQVLPEFMLPAAFLVLERLPLTPNGKIDRKALPVPEEVAVTDAGHVAPRGPVEELLATIWAEVLRRERIGASDHFFELGGHSLIATQVVSRVRQALGVELPLRGLFAHPVLADLARAVEELRRAGEGLALPPVTREPRGGVPVTRAPLSFAQERMWFLDQLDPGTSAYNLALSVRLRGDLDPAVLARCFGEVLRRHEALRTRFAAAAAGPEQIVEPAARFILPVVDLAALPGPARHPEAVRLSELAASRPFDLTRAPLLRATLLRLEPEHALVIEMHHIAADGWSMGILVNELAALYAAFSAGAPSPLPEPPVQYADFAIWQRRHLATEPELDFWRRQLAGSPPQLALPADRRRGEAAGFQAAAAEIRLPPALLAELNALARRRSASLYMVLLAAWTALLLRWSGEDDLVVGAPVANRNRAETEGLIGFFLNTLLLRTRLDGVPDFAALLDAVREVCLTTFAHQDLPLERVLQAAFPERDPGRSPHQVMFLLQNVAAMDLEVPGLAFSPFDFERRGADVGTDVFEVGLTLAEQEQGAGGALLEAEITYNALLFDPATIERLLARYGRLLAAAVEDPGRGLWELPLLDAEEERQLLSAAGAEMPPAGAAVHQRITRQALVDPAAPAVMTTAGEALTYGELERRANRLAHHLLDRGAGPERVVGVALERSPRLLVALLAVLKTGGAYLPLDPAAPDERLRDLLDSSGATLLVTSRPGLAGENLPVVRLDDETEDAAIAAGPDTAPQVDLDPASLAYVIYTSGSTGRPKGVMVPHGALANYVEAFLADARLGPRDRVLQFASISFDTSAEEIFPALAAGATLVLRDDAMLASPSIFLERCGALGITVLDLPTAYWHEMAADPAPALPAALRLLILGGDRAAPERLAAWRGRPGADRVRLLNTYGPTEATIVATRSDLTAAPPPRGEVPIGRPVPGARAWVLDPRGSLAPEEFPGVLFLGGAGIARGYRGRPDLTAERFLPDPWSAEPGARMYDTGDLARWLASGELKGQLEFLGRADQQVKIRGYRVEPAEIEAALTSHPAVAQAAVAAREDGPGGLRLVAWWAPTAAGEGPGAGELRSFLSRRLPEYMLPAAFVELPALPLTPSGKIDRRALPAPQRIRPEAAAGYVAPRTDVEETVAAVWAEVLGIDRAGAEDSFFELGGHSLLIPLVLHRLETAFGVAVPLRSLVEEPTVEGQALAIEELLLDQIERLEQEQVAAATVELIELREDLLPQRIAAQAARRGTAAMVVDGSGPVSAEKLMRRVRRVARRLRAAGVGRGDVVGVLAERTSWLITGLLGAMESGAAYLPLDPSHPAERLAWMLDDAGAAVLLGDDGPLQELARQAPDAARIPWLRLREEDGEAELESLAEIGPGIDPEDLAYVIYTSGSTGRPKGVEVTHGSLANLVTAEIEQCGLVPGMRALQFAPIGFDSSVWEIFAALASGAELHVGTREELAPGPPLARFLAERRIETATFVPSVIAALEAALDGPSEAALPELRTLVAGGEACSETLAAHWSVGRKFLNVYGPTEATVVASTEEGHVPGRVYGIGRALPNVRLYLRDTAGEPAAFGQEGSEEGEIAIGGVAVARGYRRRPELTAERFLPDPLGEPGSRLYRTGDLGRWLPDGRLEYRGRIDDQLKIRGHRIEPQEIEEALRTHPEVSDAVVVAGRIAGEKALVAYVAGRSGGALAAGELRAHLRGLLPEPLVPAAFVSLDALPLTSSNKADRRALAARALEGTGTEHAAPAGATEEALAEIWSEVFHRPAVGAEDDFFALGGHSLLAAQVLARVERRLGLALPQRALFDRPVLRELAREINGRLLDHTLPGGGSSPLGGGGLEQGGGQEGGGSNHPGNVRGHWGHPPPSLPPFPTAPSQGGGTLRPEISEIRFPLSSSQRRLWFLDRLHPGSPVYNLVVPLHVEGKVEPAALARALSEVVARHEALRTTFGESVGEPWQRVHPPTPLPLPWIDLRQAGDGAVWELARAEARRPFDLAAGPLVRALLVTGARRHLLLVFVHHIVFDGWSAHVLEAELARFCPIASAALPPPAQLRDAVRREQEWLRSPARGEQLAWWRERLDGMPQALELPADRPRPERPSHRGAIRRRALPPEVEARLRAAGRGGITLFVQLLAGFATLLGRLGGGADLAVGSPVASRGQVDLEGVIGFLVNTLVLRLDLGGEPSWRDFLGRARESALGAFAHQDLPFDLLVEELSPERDLSRSPLVQAVLALQGRSQQPAGRLRLDPRTVDTGTAKFDLTLFVEEGEGIELALEYAADLFDAPTAERWLGHFVELLAAAAAEPERRVGELPLLGPAERHQLAAEWNDSSTAYPRAALVHQLFAEQARRAPHAVALEWNTETVRYGDLLERAAGLAKQLLELGLAPEERVVVAVERSPDLIVALLGVLATGGAYVPLDAGSPAERLGWMIGDTGARLAVVDRAWRERLRQVPGAAGLRTVEVGAARAGSLPAAVIAPESLACVLYTSGTTGRPKGVALPHRGIVRLVRETDWARLGPDEVWLHLAPMAFDASTMEIWGALCNGSRLVLYPGARASLAELGGVVARHGVTTLFLTAGLFHEMVEHEVEALAPVRQLLSGGDVVSAPHVRRALAARPDRVVVDAYGPTENTTITCAFTARSSSRFGETVPLGRPIANTRVHLLDARMQPVPVGVAGELCTGGDGLARGYLGRPELTAERFVPDPFSGWGERIYRTGDLARRLPSGELEFLGRLDAQVKIRGNRVEPGEIEAALAAHPGVAQAVVLAWPQGGTDRRLVAWWVAREEEAPPTAGDLRAFLRRRLPEPMVPSSFVRLERLPLTGNGKVDRKALPAPLEAEETTGETDWAPPRTPVEELLAGLWADLLGHDRVGRDAHFFDLGGHSLLATRLVSRIRSELGVELPLATVFEEPVLAGLAAAIEARREEAGPALPPILPEPRPTAPTSLPLSFAQRRLWFLDQLVPDSPLYNILVPLRLSGPLDRPALAAALAEIARRHEALRTRFAVAPGGEEPVQVIGEALPELPQVDLSGLQAARARAEAMRELRRDAVRPFDLAAPAPPVRTALFLVAPEEHLLLASFHHIVFDGWSLAVFRRELLALYAASAAGRPSPLPDLPIQYADFALWQRRHLTREAGEALAGQLRFWRERLAGAPLVLELPADRPRPPVQSSRGATLGIAAPPRLAAALAERGRRDGVTLYMLLLAAWQAFLARLSGQEDLLVGSPAANRDRIEVEPLIGFFANTLVLRGRPAARTPFAALLRQARETALAAFAHQDLPFETLVEELRPERDLSRTPVVQAMLALPGIAREPVQTAAGLAVTPVEPAELEIATAKFDLTLGALGAGTELRFELEYATDLFDPTTAERWLGSFLELLAGAVAQPELTVSELPLLSAAERHQLVEWNDSATAYPRGALVHELVLEQARRTPGAVAVEWNEERLLYGELAVRAAGLAAALAERGLAPEERVLVAVERSPDLVVALLGVLMAGGAYVPLDAGSPPERLGWMIGDTGARLAVADRAWRERLRQVPEAADLALVEAGVARTGAPPPARVVPESLAYVTYTSGTTGRPKGVAVPHRAVVRLVRETAYLRFTPAEVFLQLGPVAFDASTAEIWGALCNGARLVLFPEEKPSLARLGEVLARHGVDTVFLTSGLFHQMVELELAALAPVRQLLAGGDVVSAAHVRRVLAAHPELTVVHLYGPTENTTFTCHCPLRAGDEIGDTLPLGRPIANTRMHVLDAELRPVPAGVAGELYAAGDGLARGYLGRPELTAERFVPDPLGDPGDRLYRTGDLARRLASGEVEFLGRLDSQVKIRGNRVEPGEVEAALALHPSVGQVVVMAWPARSGQTSKQAVERRLVAWWVARDEDAPPAAADLRAFLRGRLPEPMVPSSWVRLPELPLTPNGKVDRRALPAPEDRLERVDEDAWAAPRTPVEELVAGLFADLLGRDRVSRDGRFFDLGGHSLLATRLVARLRSALGIDLPLRHVFEAPTVADLARRIEEARRGAGSPGTPPLVPQPRSGPLPLSFAQQRLWYMDRLEAGSPIFNIPMPLELSGPLDLPALAAALAEIVRRHEALRTVFTAPEGEPRQVVLPPPSPFAAPVPPLADLSGLPLAARRGAALALAEQEGRAGFDLARGPLLRTALLHLGPEEHLLSVTLHHTIADGWSTELLHRELAALYGAFQQGRPSPLAPPAVQPADFAIWQRGWLKGAALDGLLAGWRDRFGARGLPPLRLPVDRTPAEAASSAGSYRERTLPAELAAGVRSLGRGAGATSFMVLLAAFDALLHRLGNDEVAVGTPVAGRDRVELEGVMGCFVNTLVLPVDCGGDPSFESLLGRVRETALAAYALQDLPFERLVDAIRPQRGAAPLFRVMFALQNDPGEGPEAAGVRFVPVVLGNGTAQFDLTLYLAEQRGTLRAWMEYRTALFDAATIDALLAAYEQLLAAALAAPAAPLSALPVPAELARRAAEAPALEAPAARSALAARQERLAARRAELSREKLATLERLRRGEAAGAPERPAGGAALVEIAPGDGRGLAPLFVVHGSGGDVQSFFPLARQLDHIGDGRPVYGLQAAGLAPGEEPLPTVEAMAARYVEAVRRAQPRGPYRLAGWSFGGLVAYEMAQRLRAAGEEVALLALLDSRPGLPESGDGSSPEDDLASLLLDMAAYAAKFLGKDLGLREGDLAGQGPEQQLEAFAARARAAGLVHQGGDLAHVRRLVALVRANFAAHRRYRPLPYPGSLTVIRASQGLATEAASGWERLAAAVVELEAPGDHVTLLAEPHVQALAGVLRSALAAVEATK